MDVSPILEPLNSAQREAVSAPPLPTLVLAGAGSGKTRVLVHRIAWLCLVEGASPYSVLAVTFTNKAAAEMRGRVESLLGASTRGMWVGTFHGLSHRLLRAHWREARLPQTFQILDSDDQYRLVKRVLKSLELDEARWPPRQTQWYINARKDEGLRPHQLEDTGDPISRQLVRIYMAYENACQRAGLVDFAELLLRSLETLRDDATLLAHYRERFRHLLVDEFQDTNAIQYAWLRLLAGEQPQPGILNGVSVLKFVHQQVAKTFPVMREQCRIVAQRLQRAQQKFGKVDQPGTLAGVLVSHVNPHQLTADGIAGIFQLVRAQSLVLARIDVPLRLARRPARLVQLQTFQHPLYQTILVIGIENLERLGQPRLAPVRPQQPMRKAMERAHPHAARGGAQQGFHSPAHLGGRLVGEGHRQHAVRRSALDQTQPRDAMHQHTRLAAAGAASAY